MASAPGENRLVVLILRGALDGLDALRPVGDTAFKALRPSLSDGGTPLGDGFFALHPDLSGLAPLWQAGELAFVPATSTPYRDKRSHFDGARPAGSRDRGRPGPSPRRLAEPRADADAGHHRAHRLCLGARTNAGAGWRGPDYPLATGHRTWGPWPQARLA